MWRCTRGETKEDRGWRKVAPVSWREAAWRTSGNQWRLPSVPEHTGGAESSAVGARGWYLCSRRLPKNRQRPCIILIHTSETQWSSKYKACSFIQRENMQQVNAGELFGMPPLNIHAHILGIVRAPLSFFFKFWRFLQPPPHPTPPHPTPPKRSSCRQTLINSRLHTSPLPPCHVCLQWPSPQRSRRTSHK